MINKLDDICESANNYIGQINAIQAIVNTMWGAYSETQLQALSYKTWDDICNALQGVLMLFEHSEKEKEKLVALILEAHQLERDRQSRDHHQGD